MTKKKEIIIDDIKIPMPKKSDNIYTGFQYGIDTTVPHHLKYKDAHLQFEIMGGVNIKTLDRLKVTLKISRSPLLTPLHAYRNTIDLYNDDQLERFIRQTCDKLELGLNDIKLPLYTFIDNLEKYRIVKRTEQITPQESPKIKLTPKDKKEALKMLKDEGILGEITKLLEGIGLIGEVDNGLLLFLIFLTRNFEYPLHAIVHGSSGSGKTNLLKTVIASVPDESKHITTALTENVLFYPPYKNFWSRKILMLEDLDGSMKALLPLREFMSNQKIVKFITEMDSQTGEHRQKRLSAEGPICIVGATTREKIYEDNSNRSFLIHVDESKNQQHRVMNYQNKLAAGIINLDELKEKKKLLQNMQRMLEPITVKNPFQPELELPERVFKPLRTNQHYIQLIKAVTFLHQHQREIETDEKGRKFITTTLKDICVANDLCRESFLRKSDELNGTQRRFFESLKHFVKRDDVKSTNFFSKNVRKAFGMHPQTLKRHLTALEDFGFIQQLNHSYKIGNEYQILDWNDYEVLEDTLSILDKRLMELEEKYPTA